MINEDGVEIEHGMVVYEPWKGGYYRKSEADKVIAEKDREIEEQKRLRDMALASMPNVLKVMKIIQHHKYKRCRAMAECCSAMWRRCMNWEINNRLRTGHCDSKYSNFYSRWCDKWLELAEQFKDV